MNNTKLTMLSIIVLLSHACGKVDATHPLDPDTPIDFQRTSKVAGRVIVPTGSDPASAAEVTIHLDPVSEVVSRRGGVDTDGFFAIDDVIPGHYRLSAWGPGFSGGPVVVEVVRGTELELGSIPSPQCSVRCAGMSLRRPGNRPQVQSYPRMMGMK